MSWTSMSAYASISRTCAISLSCWTCRSWCGRSAASSPLAERIDGARGMIWLVFWGSLAALVYVYAGFPLLLLVVGLVKRRGVRTRAITPRISLIVAAHNEERAIGRRLHNALEVDYPADALEIIVASDGSTDATNAIASRYVERG